MADLDEGTTVELDHPSEQTVELLEHRGVDLAGEFWIVKLFKFAGWVIMAPINSANWFFARVSEIKRK